MDKLELLTGRKYLSYSGMSSLIECGERFRLEKVLKAPQLPAWWFIAGHAIHAATENMDRAGLSTEKDATDQWLQEWEKELDGKDLTGIRAGGKQSKAYPNKEDRTYWEAVGAQHVWRYIQWRNERFDEGWSILELNGYLFIEAEFYVTIRGTQVKGFVDRVFVTDAGELLVCDLKSGSRTPTSSLQLGTYKVALEKHYGITPSLGNYFMTRTGVASEAKSLLHYTEETLGTWYDNARTMIEQELFIPNTSSYCGTCDVARFCTAQGGSVEKLAMLK